MFMLVLSGLLALADLCIWLHRKQEKEREQAWERQGRLCRMCARRDDNGRDGVNVTQAAAIRPCHPVDASPITFDDYDNDGGNDKPIWPIRWIRMADFLLAGALLWTVVVVLNVSCPGSYYEDAFSLAWMTKYYSTVPIGYSAIVHARCWWRQYRAKEMQKWVRTLGLGRGAMRIADDVESCETVPVNGTYQKGKSASRNTYSIVEDEEESANQDTKGLTNSVKATVRGLNREASKALSCKNRLARVSDSQERQPLLSDTGSNARRVRPIGSGAERCNCLPVCSCYTLPLESGRTCTYAFIDSTDDNLGNRADSATIRLSEETATGLSTRKATRSGTDSVSDSSSTADSCGSHQDRTKNEKNDRADIDDSIIASHLNATPHDHEASPVIVNDEDDEDIMVVKKAKKGKAKLQKGKKRDTEVE